MKAASSDARTSNAQPLRAVALSMVAFCCATAAAAEEQQKLFIEGDIVRGNTPNGHRPGLRARKPV